MIYLAFGIPCSLFKYLLRFLVVLRPLIGLNKSVSTEKKKRIELKQVLTTSCMDWIRLCLKSVSLNFFSNKHEEVPFLGTLLYCWWEYNATTMGISMEFSQRTKNGTIILSSNPIPEHLSRENHNLKRCMHPNVHCSTINNSQDMEAT